MESIELPERLDGASLVRLRVMLDVDRRSVLVIRGGPAAFCRGMDLGEAEAADADESRLFAAVLIRLRSARRPTVAVVEGEAFGGGVGLAAACDRVIATPSATFGLPEGLFGLVPAMVAPVLLERMAPQSVRLMALDGASRSACWGLSRGLVDEVVEASELASVLSARVRQLSRVRPDDVARLREWIDRARGLPTDAAITVGADVLTDRLRDPGVALTLRAFVEEGRVPWR